MKIKNKLLVLLALFFSINSYTQTYYSEPATYNASEDFYSNSYTGGNNNSSSSSSDYGIEDGWYTATVKYYNYKTGTRSTYTLDVKVVYDRVVNISFGNDGSVHNGYNNSGYIYSGGSLNYSNDYDGNITGGTATVTVNYSNGTMVSFNIKI